MHADQNHGPSAEVNSAPSSQGRLVEGSPEAQIRDTLIAAAAKLMLATAAASLDRATLVRLACDDLDGLAVLLEHRTGARD